MADRASKGLPYNPGVRELVAGKRQWSGGLGIGDQKRGFRGWHERGYLPHRDAPGLTQFVTFHLTDSFPAGRRSEWQALLEIEDNRERRLRFEDYLDRCHGECWLRRPDIANLVNEALRFHHSKSYDLRAWVVMPNHIHFLMKINQISLAEIIKNFKRYTTREANKILQRTGSLWHEDYFDTYMRNDEHELRTRRYIENNPVKARLVLDPKCWAWSSARFRDESGCLSV
ncbi:MAG TPA: transposase [Desulfuromonadaceae bacterium]|nr:transposase [Desulfuromonadaceae bacterium]